MRAERLRRAERQDGALGGEAAAHLRGAQHAVGLAVEPGHGLLRRAGRRHQAEPCGELDRQPLFDHGRHIRQHIGALLGRDAERARAAVLDARDGERHHVEHHEDVAGDQILLRRSRALVGHVGDVDSGRELEQFAADVAGGADALRGVGQLAGVRLGVGDQLLHVLRGHRRMHGEDVRHHDHVDDRHQLLGRIVRQLLQVRQDREHAVVPGQQRVAVGRRLRDRLGGRNAGRAAAILDHHGGLAVLADLGREHARDDVGDAAGRDRHDDPDRLRRKVLRRARAPARRRGQQQAG